MATIHSKILSAADQNAHLLKALSETDYAMSALQQNTTYIDSIKAEIAAEEKNLRNISRTVASEYADHKKYRDSHMRRLAYKLGGKKEDFAERASKEESEWLEAVKRELHTKKALEQLNKNLSEATTAHAELSSVVSVHESTKTGLDELYKSIFEGPTPDVPGEDEKEQAVKEAENNFNSIQFRLSAETQARDILIEADKFLTRALKDLADALDAATMDAWGIGGSFADMAESSALSRAQSHVSQTEMLITQAQRIQPSVRAVGPMNVAQMHFMTDVVFDNVFSDFRARDRIKESQRCLSKARQGLVGQVNEGIDRITVAKTELSSAGGLLDRRREDLQMVRREAFDSISRGGYMGEGAPPGYDSEPPSYQA